MRKLLRIRNARLFLFGDVVSTLGDSALWLAMAIWMKELTHSSAAAGLVFFAYAAGSLLSPLGGALADRFRRRPLLICSNLAAAALVMLIVLVHHRSQIWLVYLVVFLYGVIGSAIGPAQTALLPALVPDDLLAEANGAQQTLNEGIRLIVPLVGAGLFVLVGAAAVAEIDAGTFLVAVASLLALRVTEPRRGPAGTGVPAAGTGVPAAAGAGGPATAGAGVPAAGTGVPAAAGAGGPATAGGGGPAVAGGGGPAAGAAGRMTAGFRFIRHEPVLLSITIALGLSMLVIGFTESALFSVVTVGLRHSASFVGIMMSVQGIGAVGGGLTAAVMLKRMPEGMLTALALAIVATGILLLTLPSTVAVLAGMMLAGAALPWVLVAASTAIQRRTPSALLGRVSGAFGLALTVPQVLSVGLGAALIAVVNYRILLVVIAVVVTGAATFLIGRPESRSRTTPDVMADPAVGAERLGPDAVAGTDAAGRGAATASSSGA